MKKILFLSIICFFWVSNIYSQDWNILTYVPPANNKIMIRWMPPTFNNWQSGISNGYSITKKRYSSTGVFEANETSIVISPILPSDTTQTKWISYWKNDSTIYKQLFYLTINQKLIQTSISNRELSVSAPSTNDSERYFFANILSDSKYKAAELCGLGYTDLAIVSGKKYEYIITTNGANPTSQSTGLILVSGTILPDIPINFTHENKRIKVNFGNTSLEDSYSGYYVEKSINAGATYTRLNTIPYINLADSTAKLSFADSIPNETQTYRYRVLGISYFDHLKYSTPKDTTIKKMLEFSPGITSIIPQNTNIKVNWRYPINNTNNLPFNLNTDLSLFKLGVSKKDTAKLSNSSIFKILRANISKTDTTVIISKSEIFTALGDTNSVYYFFIAAYGAENDVSLSLPYGYSPVKIDNIPPSTPTAGLISKPINISNNKMLVKVSWNISTDVNGVLGYRVFRTIGTDLEKIEVSGGIVTNLDGTTRAFSNDTIAQNLDYKLIKYYVSAFDSSYNESSVLVFSYSQPDKRRPMPATFKSASLVTNNNNSNSILLIFRQSPSKINENILHEIFRKEDSPGQNWTVIKTITTAQSDTSYIDSNTLEGKTYVYSILAKDDSLNYSCDSLPTLLGSSSPLPGYCYPLINIKTLVLSQKPALTTLTQTYSEGSKSITLNWTYAQPNIVGYEIYRGTVKAGVTTKPAFLDFAAGSIILTYIDSKVDFDSTYLYKVRANFADGSVSSWKDVQTASLKLSKLSLDKNAISFERTANSNPIVITSNIAWTITSNVSWLTPSVGSGSNNATINLNVSANTGNAKRTGVLTIIGAGLTSTIDIEQFAPPTGTGITAKYYNYTSLNDIQTREPNISRLETQINIGTGGSPASGIFDDFVAIWEGEIEVPQNGNYTFYVSADDGALLYLNGNKIITTNFSEVASAIQTLSAGQKYPIRLEYWDASSWSGVTLQWSNNVGLSKQVITTPYLYPKSIPTANDADPLHNKCFVMRNTSTDKTFQSPGDYSFKELTYNSKNYQKWKFVKNGSGYNIISQIDAQNKTLQVINDGNNLYDKLTIGYLGNKSSEIWSVTNQWGNTYQIQRASSSLYIGPGWDDYPRLFNGGQNINLESTECPNYSTGIILDTDELTYDYQQQTKSILLKSDVEWTAINYNDWISVTPPYGLQNTTVNVLLAKNILTQPRDGVIGFKSNNGVVNVKINQGPKPCIEVSNISTECSVKSISGVYIDGSNSFNSGVYEFSVDNTNNWKPYQWQIQFLTNGEHILHVRKIAEPTCIGSMSFSIYCN